MLQSKEYPLRCCKPTSALRIAPQNSRKPRQEHQAASSMASAVAFAAQARPCVAFRPGTGSTCR